MNPTQRQVLADAYDEGARAALDLAIEVFENAEPLARTPESIIRTLVELKAGMAEMAKGLERKPLRPSQPHWQERH